jgi:hypothetical protein
VENGDCLISRSEVVCLCVVCVCGGGGGGAGARPRRAPPPPPARGGLRLMRMKFCDVELYRRLDHLMGIVIVRKF